MRRGRARVQAGQAGPQGGQGGWARAWVVQGGGPPRLACASRELPHEPGDAPRMDVLNLRCAAPTARHVCRHVLGKQQLL